jgi:protein-tyrosine phosphatase
MSFFKRMLGKTEQSLPPADLSLVGIDMHSHFIPGIDDGAQNMDETMFLLRAMKDFGYRKVITTPHIYTDLYPNTAERILDGLAKVREQIAADGLEIEIEAAAEYFLDEHFESLIEEKKLLTFGNNYVLFELGFMQEPPTLPRAIFNMHLQGYKPVLAHPERYEYWNGRLSKYEELLDRDVLIQLNVNCLTGHYGQEVKATSEKLVDAGMVHFIGSDCHHPGHLNMLAAVRSNPRVHKLIESGKLLNMQL